MDDKEFKNKLEEIGIFPEEVSILRGDEDFDCKLKKHVEIKHIMFLGLNRSLPQAYKLPYHNMRGPLLELFHSIKGGKEVLKRVKGAYLTDFVKDKILKESGFEEVESSGNDVFNHLRNKKDILEICKRVLEKEIKSFNIKQVFVFGGKTWDLLKKAYGKGGLEGDSRFFKLNHYAKTNASGRKKIPKEIIGVMDREQKSKGKWVVF